MLSVEMNLGVNENFSIVGFGQVENWSVEPSVDLNFGTRTSNIEFYCYLDLSWSDFVFELKIWMYYNSI